MPEATTSKKPAIARRLFVAKIDGSRRDQNFQFSSPYQKRNGRS